MEITLTNNEKKVLQFFVDELVNWRIDEPSYSCVGGDDATKHFADTYTGKQISGICSSLFKKGFLTDGYGDGKTVNVEWDKVPEII